MRLLRKHELGRLNEMSTLNRLLQWLAAFLSLVAAIAILILAGLPNRGDYSGSADDNGRVRAPEVNSRAPSFTLPALSSRALALEPAQGSITIINFWATWCQPCRREMRDLQRLYENYPGQLRILAVNLGESIQDVRDWVDQLGLTYDILLDRQGVAAARYQVRGLPSTYVLDSDHIIRRLYYGAVSHEQLRQDLSQLGRRA